MKTPEVSLVGGDSACAGAKSRYGQVQDRSVNHSCGAGSVIPGDLAGAPYFERCSGGAQRAERS
jgi:hypothetical protein